MAYSALDVAKWFINSIDRESGESISHLKIQKLLYYAEAWTQLIVGKNLFNEEIQAWAHGPVVPEVFHALKEYGWDAIPNLESAVEFDAETKAVLSQVLDIYGEFSAKTLENMTHSDAPWIAARTGLSPEDRCEKIIDKKKIKTYFHEKFGEFLSNETT